MHYLIAYSGECWRWAQLCLQVRKLSLGEMKQLAQWQTASKRWTGPGLAVAPGCVFTEPYSTLPLLGAYLPGRI